MHFTEGLESAAEALQVFTDGLPLLFGATASDPDTRPYAYLNYLIFDEQFNSLDAGAMRVPTTAGFDPGFELLPHQEVKFQPVAITTTGYMYVWVSNESEDTKVWFDDLAITQSQDIVTQATDYGVWGEVLREQKTNVLDEYRYGYQGQFAEKDEETGWSAFELRMFDPIIARWLIPDPYKQYWSPYMAMGNNPVNLTDPSGGMTDCPKCDAAATQWGALADQFAGRASRIPKIDEFLFGWLVDLFDLPKGEGIAFYSTNGYGELYHVRQGTATHSIVDPADMLPASGSKNKPFPIWHIPKTNAAKKIREILETSQDAGEAFDKIKKVLNTKEIEELRRNIHQTVHDKREELIFPLDSTESIRAVEGNRNKTVRIRTSTLNGGIKRDTFNVNVMDFKIKN